jgi:DNA processing protein
MTNLSDEAKAAIVLTTRLGGSERPSLTAKAWHALTVAVGTPSVVFTEPDTVPAPMREQVIELVGTGAGALLDLERQMQKGIWAVTDSDDEYPAQLRRLGDQAPPVLLGAGNPALLADHASVGIVGSRGVDPAGARVAELIARAVVGLGRIVTSGAARGVDLVAMTAGLMARGSAVGVIADSLDRRLRDPETLEALHSGSLCLVTQQHPSAGFSAAAAYGRNKVIYGLSDSTVVVAADLRQGGTWKGAVEALRLSLDVIVWRGEGEGPGNAYLETMGGRPLKDVDDLASLLARGGRADPEQLTII